MSLIGSDGEIQIQCTSYSVSWTLLAWLRLVYRLRHLRQVRTRSIQDGWMRRCPGWWSYLIVTRSLLLLSWPRDFAVAAGYALWNIQRDAMTLMMYWFGWVRRDSEG